MPIDYLPYEPEPRIGAGIFTGRARRERNRAIQEYNEYLRLTGGDVEGARQRFGERIGGPGAAEWPTPEQIQQKRDIEQGKRLQRIQEAREPLPAEPIFGPTGEWEVGAPTGTYTQFFEPQRYGAPEFPGGPPRAYEPSPEFPAGGRLEPIAETYEEAPRPVAPRPTGLPRREPIEHVPVTPVVGEIGMTEARPKTPAEYFRALRPEDIALAMQLEPKFVEQETKARERQADEQGRQKIREVERALKAPDLTPGQQQQIVAEAAPVLQQSEPGRQYLAGYYKAGEAGRAVSAEQRAKAQEERQVEEARREQEKADQARKTEEDTRAFLLDQAGRQRAAGNEIGAIVLEATARSKEIGTIVQKALEQPKREKPTVVEIGGVRYEEIFDPATGRISYAPVPGAPVEPKEPKEAKPTTEDARYEQMAYDELAAEGNPAPTRDQLNRKFFEVKGRAGRPGVEAEAADLANAASLFILDGIMPTLRDKSYTQYMGPFLFTTAKERLKLRGRTTGVPTKLAKLYGDLEHLRSILIKALNSSRASDQDAIRVEAFSPTVDDLPAAARAKAKRIQEILIFYRDAYAASKGRPSPYQKDRDFTVVVQKNRETGVMEEHIVATPSTMQRLYGAQEKVSTKEQFYQKHGFASPAPVEAAAAGATP
jgi:hypothetical protein